MEQKRLDNSPIVYYVNGNSHPIWVLFLHAAFVDHTMFSAQIEKLQGTYNLLLLDILGHGQSTDTKKGDSIVQMADWIHAILEKEQIATIHIVGISLGAVLAQDFANKYPDAVASLACFGGYDINNFDKSLQKSNSAAQIGMMCRALVSIRWFAKANKKISAYKEAAQNAFYQRNLQFSKRSLRYLASLSKMVNVHKTKPRKYPLLVGCGAHDIPMSQTAIEQWKQHEPDIKTVLFENAGHCVNMDDPDTFHTVMCAFWKSCEKI